MQAVIASLPGLALVTSALFLEMNLKEIQVQLNTDIADIFKLQQWNRQVRGLKTTCSMMFSSPLRNRGLFLSLISGWSNMIEVTQGESRLTRSLIQNSSTDDEVREAKVEIRKAYHRSVISSAQTRLYAKL